VPVWDQDETGFEDKMNSKDNFEIQLGPREWGVKLADEMRRDASKGARPAEVPAAGALAESLRLGPFYGLEEQAKLLRPGNELEDIRAWNQLSQKFRTEYGGMKALILKVNEAVKEKTEALRLKVALEVCALYKLILDDGLAQPAGSTPAPAPERKTDDVYEAEENEFMMNEAAIYDDEASGDDEIFLEMPGNGLPHGRTEDSGFSSLMKNWAADSTQLITTVFTYKAAAQTIQEKYFAGHAILFEDVEARLNETIQAMEDAAATFNEYLKIRVTSIQAGSQTHSGAQRDYLTLDVQAIRAGVGRNLVDPLVFEWEEFAKNKALAEIRRDAEELETRIPEGPARQSQACEIPITVQGSRNTRVPQPFLEETYTAEVFANGAVLRLLEVLTHGQIVIVQNVRLKQEAACRVVSFKPSASVDGNVEVEFIQPAPGFWGIDFPVENSISGSNAAANAPLPLPAPQVRHAEPTIVAPPEPSLPPIEQKKIPALFVQEVIPLGRKAEAPAPPATEIPPSAPEVIAEKRPEPAVSTPQIEAAVATHESKPTPKDSAALNTAIIAAYAMPIPTPPVAHAPAMPPAIAKVLATKEEKVSISEARAVETIPEPIETAREASPNPARDWEVEDTEPSTEEPQSLSVPSSAKRRKIIFAAAAVLGVLILSGVSVYLWNLRWKSAISMPPANAASFKAPSGSVALVTAELPPATNPKATPSTGAASNAIGKDNKSASQVSGAKNAPADKSAQDTTNVAVRQPSTLPFQISAPVTHSAGAANTKSDAAITTPDINPQPTPQSPGDQNALLGSIVSGNSAPAPPRVPGPVTTERNFVEPRILTMIPVIYPRLAIQRRDEGDVMVTAMVNATGKVIGTKAISGPMTLRQAAANAVSMWKFEPGMLNGKPADSVVTVKVTFKLPH
jgi:TonB family protein